MDGAGGLFRGACAEYESQKPLCEVTSQAEAGDRESYVSSYAAGRQPNDIRMMTTECPQKTLSICTCLDSMETVLARRKGLLWTGCTCRRVQRGSWGVVQRGCKIVWLHSGSLHSQRWLEVRSTGYLSRKHQSSAEEVVSTITSVRGARYDVGSVRFSNKSASNGPSPVPSV